MSNYDKPDVQPLLQALDQAHEAQTRFDVAHQLQAEGHDTDVRAERIRFQQFVVGLFKRLRPYLVSKLEGYYEDARVYDGKEGQIIGLKQLHHYQGAVSESATFDGNDVATSREPALMPPQACRNALDLLTECTYQLGFVPEARKREREFSVGGDPDEPATADASGD